MNLTPLLLLALLVFLGKTNSFTILSQENLLCKSTGIQCTGNSEYTSCDVAFGWIILRSQKTLCPVGYICNDEKNPPCVDPNEKPVTTFPESEEIECGKVGVGRFPTKKCNQYVDCYRYFFVFGKRFVTCEKGKIFDKKFNECVSATNEQLKCIQ